MKKCAIRASFLVFLSVTISGARVVDAEDFFPVQKGDIWIYASRAVGIPPVPDTLIVVPDVDIAGTEGCFRLYQSSNYVGGGLSEQVGLLKKDVSGNVLSCDGKSYVFDFSDRHSPRWIPSNFVDVSTQTIRERLGTSAAIVSLRFHYMEFDHTYNFADGIGLVHAYTNLDTWYIMWNLIWARVDGVEYGEHPGESYPRYLTPVKPETWGGVKTEFR